MSLWVHSSASFCMGKDFQQGEQQEGIEPVLERARGRKRGGKHAVCRKTKCMGEKKSDILIMGMVSCDFFLS